MLVEQMERRVLVDRQGLIARGVSKDLPTLTAEQEAFNAWLAEEPKPAAALTEAESEQLALRRALGVA